MPVSLSYPGVYIEEVPSGVRTITGVATSIAAFVGYTRMGEPDRAVRIFSFADFERTFGGLDRDSPVSYGVRQFFANGGTQALVVRVATGFSSASWVLKDSAPLDVLDVSASSPGSWGNELRITVQRAEARNPDAEFNLVIAQLVTQGGVTQQVTQENHRNLNLNPASPQFAPSVVNNVSRLVRIAMRPGLTFNQTGFAVSKPITFPLTVNDRVLAGTIDGTTPFRLELSATPADIDGLVTALTTAINNGGVALQASKSGPDGGAGTDSLKLASPTSGATSAVTMAGGAFGGLASVIGIGLANGGREFTGDTQHRPAAVADLAPATAGVNGTKGNEAQLVGAGKTGMQALLDTDLFNILSIPETFDLPEASAKVVVQAAVGLCEARRAFYVVDPPAGKNLEDIAAWANGASQSRNAAVYFPAVQIADPLDQFRPRPMAPSGTISGVYARTDSERGVWKAPAGTDATLRGVDGLSKPLNDLENGVINLKGVNALRVFPAFGAVAWGARTMKGSEAQADEYKYVPVRRMALFLEESLYRGTQWVVFEPNDEPLWAQIRLNIGAFMQNLFRQGAFQGTSPREAYFVKCDRETNTQADVDLGIVNILVGFAPLKPAEFVVIKLQQMAGDIRT